MNTNGTVLGSGTELPLIACDRPASLDALCELVKRRADAGQPLYPEGGGTARDYGRTPRRPGVKVDVRSLDRVVDYPAADMTITVEAGLTIAGLQSILAAEGQRLPLDTPFPDQATLGGVWATASSGPRRFGWGRARDLIIGVRFVTADGVAIKGGGRVVKNVAGYDFPRLLTGSLGTLGIIAEMTLKVRPIPEAFALVLVSCPTLESAGALLESLNTSSTRPVIQELLNRSASRVLEEWVRLDQGEWVVVLGYEDNAKSVAWQTEAIAREIDGRPCEILTGQAGQDACKALVDHVAGLTHGPVSLTANVPASAVVELLDRAAAGDWAVQAHAGNGIVHMHLLDPSPKTPPTQAVAALREFATRRGGNLIVPRCPAPWEERLLPWGAPRGDWPLMRRIQAALDPQGLMNPGRFIGMMESVGG